MLLIEPVSPLQDKSFHYNAYSANLDFYQQPAKDTIFKQPCEPQVKIFMSE